MRSGDEDAGQQSLQKLFRPQLMRRIAVAMQKQDRDGFNAIAFQLFRDAGDLVFIQRLQHFAAREHALIGFQAVHARNQRLVFREIEIVGIRPVHPADFVNVAEAFGDQQRSFGARAFQHRVDGDSRTVQEQGGRGNFAAGFGNSGFNSLNQGIGSGERLAESELSAAFIKCCDVSECTADIRGDAQHGGHPRRATNAARGTISRRVCGAK